MTKTIRLFSELYDSCREYCSEWPKFDNDIESKINYVRDLDGNNDVSVTELSYKLMKFLLTRACIN
jgi:hypothetical protein